MKKDPKTTNDVTDPSQSINEDQLQKPINDSDANDTFDPVDDFENMEDFEDPDDADWWDEDDWMDDF